MKQPSRVLRIKKCISWMFFGKSQRDTFGTRDQLPEVMPQLDEVQDWYRNVPPRKNINNPDAAEKETNH